MKIQFSEYESARVLLIDDNTSVKSRIEGFLKEWDMVVVFASTGKDAMCNIEKEPPDIILLDIRLPDINGYDLCKRLRTKNGTRSIPVVIISNNSSEREKIRGLESGADDCIANTCEKNELAARLRAIMRSYH